MPFSLANLAYGALSLVAVFLGGMYIDHSYGPNAKWKASREAADRALNTVLTDQAEQETANGVGEDARFAAADAEFKKTKITQCIVTTEQVKALNLIGE